MKNILIDKVIRSILAGFIALYLIDCIGDSFGNNISIHQLLSVLYMPHHHTENQTIN
jgi:hypothetical protein